MIEIAKLNRLRPWQQEKHYIQSLILNSLSELPLVFKGGTYLWFFHGLKRFSEDLDFTYNGKDIETTVFPVLAKKKEISAFRDDSLWIGVDSEKELEQVRSEYKGRTDMPYGYNRKIYDHGDASLLEYLIRGGKKAIIENGKVVRIISGNGIIASGTNTNYSAGAVLERKGTMEFQSLTDTRLELLSY